MMSKVLRYMGTYVLGEGLKEKIRAYARRRKILKFYSRFIEKGDLCFDVGANVGEKTGIFLELGARVIAVEPQEKCLAVLRRRFSDENKVTIVEKAVGEKEGKADMMVSEKDIISSLSKEWIEKVKDSGRFASEDWNRTIQVPVTTIDKLIEDFGRPVFCKIDVEGYEFQVLNGMTRPVKYISFEFTPERREEAVKCIKRLSSLGKVKFNYSGEENGYLEFRRWISDEKIIDFLEAVPLKEGPEFNWGDVYAMYDV